MGLVLLLVIALLLSCGVGAVSLSVNQLLQLCMAGVDEHVQRVVFELRLPRALLAALVGVNFALAGLLLQSITRNPLAESGVLGISAGSSFCAVVTLVMLGLFAENITVYQVERDILLYLPGLAMLGGILAALAVYQLSGGAGSSPLRLILTGVIVAAILNAIVTAVLAIWGQAQTEMILAWLAGSLHGRGWPHLNILWPWTLLGLIGCFFLLRPLRLMALTDDQIGSLGLNIQRWRMLALLLAALLAASAVGVVGPVGFVGLLVPHISRRLAQHDTFYQCVFCVLVGALLMVAADVVGRILLPPFELPVGVVTALLGVPFFLYLLRKQP